MNFERATTADASTLAEMNWHLIRDEGHRNRMSIAELESRMSGWLNGEYDAILFKEAKETVGYVLFRREPEYVYLRQFYIRSEYRRRGMGRTALAWLGEHAWGKVRVRLEVLVGNAVAISFWRSVGFRDYCLTMEHDGEIGKAEGLG
jgi:ribosomal protein S18 acetylase RimI-like enzyme